MDRYLAAYERRIGASVASGAVFSVAMQLSYLAGFCYGCWGILAGRMSYGTLMALVQLVGQVRAPLSSLSGVVHAACRDLCEPRAHPGPGPRTSRSACRACGRRL